MFKRTSERRIPVQVPAWCGLIGAVLAGLGSRWHMQWLFLVGAALLLGGYCLVQFG